MSGGWMSRDVPLKFKFLNSFTHPTLIRNITINHYSKVRRGAQNYHLRHTYIHTYSAVGCGGLIKMAAGKKGGRLFLSRHFISTMSRRGLMWRLWLWCHSLASDDMYAGSKRRTKSHPHHHHQPHHLRLRLCSKWTGANTRDGTGCRGEWDDPQRF